MKVTLLHFTPLNICSNAIRTCWQSFDKSDNGGEKDIALIERVGNKYKHSSTLEHLHYNFYIQGISRACLQELARHRIASLSVKSSRYTLKELKGEESFWEKETQNLTRKNPSLRVDSQNLRGNPQESLDSANVPIDSAMLARAGKYIVLTGDEAVDCASINALENLRILVQSKSNDFAKYAMPECYKTELAWSINARSLQNFLSLRTAKSALWEIRTLARAVYSALPYEHKFIYNDFMEGLNDEK